MCQSGKRKFNLSSVQKHWRISAKIAEAEKNCGMWLMTVDDVCRIYYRWKEFSVVKVMKAFKNVIYNKTQQLTHRIFCSHFQTRDTSKRSNSTVYFHKGNLNVSVCISNLTYILPRCNYIRSVPHTPAHLSSCQDPNVRVLLFYRTAIKTLVSDNDLQKKWESFREK